ncbi:MAG: hypothetical protein QOJ39_2206 [Candidatus Eremiobacteraeota bacterium]|jgi:hypothetical protein|nr:hypothetical protein [Candidatus Eremiobacteraeota bacterium]
MIRVKKIAGIPSAIVAMIVPPCGPEFPGGHYMQPPWAAHHIGMVAGLESIAAIAMRENTTPLPRTATAVMAVGRSVRMALRRAVLAIAVAAATGSGVAAVAFVIMGSR